MTTIRILDLPQELLSNILAHLPPIDIVRFGRINHAAHVFISPLNQILWHSAFVQIFDEPEDAWSQMPQSYVSPRHDWDWYTELRQRLIALQLIRKGWSLSNDGQTYEVHIDSLLSIVDTAKFCLTKADLARGEIPSADDRSSLNLKLLTSSSNTDLAFDKLIHDVRSNKEAPMAEISYPPGRPVTRAMSSLKDVLNRPEAASRLHVLYGITERERRDHKSQGRARRKVYNWNLTSNNTDYGPFDLAGSGKVNWSLLEGVCTVICRNFERCVDGHLAIPSGFAYSIPSRTLIDPTIPHDWARVTGSWYGTYAFLDYADLFSFNTGLAHWGAPTLDDEPEACGDLMKLELRLDNSVKDDRRLKTQVPINYDVPPLYFVGMSSGHDHHRPVVQVKGLVSLLPSGREVRWKFIIAYNGADQWQLEGVQPGGIRSGGVYGLWSQVDHEDNGPVGPFCYFPLELCKPTSVVLIGTNQGVVQA